MLKKWVPIFIFYGCTKELAIVGFEHPGRQVEGVTTRSLAALSIWLDEMIWEGKSLVNQCLVFEIASISIARREKIL
ncbi:MAG: hypothetical protein ABIG61_05710 [Planctomycetota bacterium]